MRDSAFQGNIKIWTRQSLPASCAQVGVKTTAHRSKRSLQIWNTRHECQSAPITSWLKLLQKQRNQSNHGTNHNNIPNNSATLVTTTVRASMTNGNSHDARHHSHQHWYQQNQQYHRNHQHHHHRNCHIVTRTAVLLFVSIAQQTARYHIQNLLQTKWNGAFRRNAE